MLVRLGVLDPQLAATKVQKVFRGHQARQRVFVMRQDELEFLGMVETRCRRLRSPGSPCLDTVQ